MDTNTSPETAQPSLDTGDFQTTDQVESVESAEVENQKQQIIAPIQQRSELMKVLMFMVVAVLAAVIVGAGVYAWQQTVLKAETAELKMQQTDLETKTQELEMKMMELGETNTELNIQLGEVEKIASEAAAEKEELLMKTCVGVWKDGECVKASCIDADVNEKPNDIYISSFVSYTNPNDPDSIGGRFEDDCSSDEESVHEMYCRESRKGSGIYEPATTIEVCPKGCFNGACNR